MQRINMRLPRVFDRRRRRYEDLVTQHLDGVLDAAGEARLREVLRADPALAVEVRELEAVTARLRAEPMVEPPRSFALPYAPAPVPEAPRPGALRWMQAATVTAALVLVTLIGVDLVVAPAGGPEAPASSAVTAEIDLDTPADGPEGPKSSAAPAEEAPVELQFAEPPPDAPAIDSAVGADIQQDEAEVQDRPLAREPEPVPAPVAQPVGAAGPSALDWAQLGLGVVTASLAIGVALVSWRAARRRA